MFRDTIKLIIFSSDFQDRDGCGDEQPTDEAIYCSIGEFITRRYILPQGPQRLVEVLVGRGDGSQHKGLSIPTQRFLSIPEPDHEQTSPRRYC